MPMRSAACSRRAVEVEPGLVHCRCRASARSAGRTAGARPAGRLRSRIVARQRASGMPSRQGRRHQRLGVVGAQASLVGGDGPAAEVDDPQASPIGTRWRSSICPWAMPGGVHLLDDVPDLVAGDSSVHASGGSSSGCAERAHHEEDVVGLRWRRRSPRSGWGRRSCRGEEGEERLVLDLAQPVEGRGRPRVAVPDRPPERSWSAACRGRRDRTPSPQRSPPSPTASTTKSPDDWRSAAPSERTSMPSSARRRSRRRGRAAAAGTDQQVHHRRASGSYQQPGRSCTGWCQIGENRAECSKQERPTTKPADRPAEVGASHQQDCSRNCDADGWNPIVEALDYERIAVEGQDPSASRAMRRDNPKARAASDELIVQQCCAPADQRCDRTKAAMKAKPSTSRTHRSATQSARPR